MMGMGAAPTMAVSGDSVYVLRGNKIYRLDAKTLKVLATGELPDDRPMAPAVAAPATPSAGGREIK
jgi:hypothetical protein